MAAISNSAEQATEHVKDAASHARSTFLDLSTQVMKLINTAREAEGRGVDTLLDRIGLQRRQSALGPVLWFAAGAAAAGAIALLLAPASGRELRHRIVTFLGGEMKPKDARPGAPEAPVEQGADARPRPAGNGTAERRTS